MDGSTQAGRRGRIMRITDKGVDHKSPADGSEVLAGWMSGEREGKKERGEIKLNDRVVRGGWGGREGEVKGERSEGVSDK